MTPNLKTLLLRHLPAAGFLGLLLSALLPGISQADTGLDGLRTQIELGYQERSLTSIEAVRTDLLALAAEANRSPDAQSTAAYVAAYARFRQALAVQPDHTAARAYLDDCIVELREVVRQQPNHAEAHALLGSCLGLSTLHDVVATVTRGLEARRQMRQARRLAPDNPWVVMQDGLADWATPRLFGGNRTVALAKLERAAGLFTAATETGSRMAAWGAAETFQQLGIRYRELGRSDAAQLAFERAAELMPVPLRLAAARP